MIWFIAFSERMGKYGAIEYLEDRLGITLDLDSKNMCPKIGDYKILRIDTRDVPMAVEIGAFFGITCLDWFEDYLIGGYGRDLEILEELPYIGKTEICAFKRKGEELNEKPYYPVTLRIVSPYKNIARKYMNGFKWFVSISPRPLQYVFSKCKYCDKVTDVKYVEPIRGKTEGWLKANFADLVIDNRNTGTTQEETELEIYDKIMDSYAIVISRKENKNIVREVLGL